MFRFFQPKEGKHAWQLVPDNRDTMRQLAADKVPFITILAVSADPDDEENPDNLKYRGDFYIDIDRSGDGGGIPEAIEDAQRLVKVLADKGVTEVQLFCSGSKGFHIVVPARLFSSNRPLSHLPLIYKEMAMHLAAEANADGADMVVYSAGKGRMWRQPNVRRKNDKFKVPITAAELESMTAEMYAELIMSPRDIDWPKQEGVAVGMSTLFSSASDKVKRMMRYASSAVGLEKSELKGLSFETGCIAKLIKVGDQKDGANFNRMALVLASFIKDKGYTKEEYQPVLRQVAKNVKSGTYRTVGVRYKHLEGLVHTALSNKSIKFATKYLYSVITPCKNCELCQKHAELPPEEEASDVLEVDASGVRVQGFRYVKGRDEEARPITNFTIRVDRIYMRFDPELKRFVRERSDVSLLHAAGTTPVTLEDECFISKNALSKAIVGVSNLVVKGNDMDVVAIKEHVFSKTGESELIYSADKYGMMEAVNPSNSTRYLIYVEPHFSISMTGALNQYRVPEGQGNFPKLHTANPIESPDYIRQAVKCLFTINKASTISMIVGWFIACFYKLHFSKRFNGQFPLLHVFGNAGSGKTATVELVSYLHGLDFTGHDNITNLGSGTTQYGVKQLIASSSTVPVVFDEMNAGKVKDYDKICELLKACWTGQSVAQGTLAARKSGGTIDRIASISLSGPVCTLGEQRIDMPALVERSIQVHLRLTDRELAKDFPGVSPDSSFSTLSHRKGLLTGIGKMVMMSALKTSATHVEDLLLANRKHVPDGMSDRPTYSRAVILTGLDLLAESMKANDADVDDYVMKAKQYLIESFEDNQKSDIAEVSRTEVDRVLEFMTSMVTFDDQAAHGVMRDNYEFMIHDGNLMIDFNRCMPIYRRAAISAGLRPVFQNFSHMQRHLQDEDYFVGYRDFQNAAGQRCKFAVLDPVKLGRKGVDVTYFYHADSLTEEQQLEGL